MMTINVRVGGNLAEFVRQNVSSDGDYDNLSEYIRDLIRRDKSQKDQVAFELMKAELKLAFAEEETAYEVLSPTDIYTRNTKKS